MYLESVSCFLLLKVQMHKFPFKDLSQKDVAFCLQPPADLVEGLFFFISVRSLCIHSTMAFVLELIIFCELSSN